MVDRSAIDVWNRRLPLYAYLEPLIAGRKVLEIGCGIGLGADFLLAKGAASVVAVDGEASVIDRARARYRRPGLEFIVAPDLTAIGGAEASFDVVLAPDADDLLRRPATLGEWRRLLGSRGHLIAVVTSADRRGSAGGMGYYELAETLGPLFEKVRMFGQTPFLGFGLAEFDAADEGLRVDSGLVEGGSEEPTHYVAVAGPQIVASPGYALVQIPFAPFEARLLRSAAGRADAAVAPVDFARVAELEGAVARLQAEARLSEGRVAEAERRAAELEARGGGASAVEEARRQAAEARAERDAMAARLDGERVRLVEVEGRVAELRRKVDEATTQAEAATRVSRAQSDEIEDVRGRLRRAADDRAELEGEVGKLRKALAQADESVANLTRRTAEEMETLMARLAAGVRSQAEADALRERVAEATALGDEVARLRERLAASEARAADAERRAQAGAVDAAATEKLARAEALTREQRAELDQLGERLRAAQGEIADLATKAKRAVEQEARIAQLETEKQEALWRANQAEAQGGGLGDLREAIVSRDKAIEEFRRASAAHVDEATRLRAAVSDQAALVAELEETLAVTERRGEAAEASLAQLREQTRLSEDNERARRTRLAEVEGKLLRLERQAAARDEDKGAAPSADVEALRQEAALWRSRAEEIERAAAATAARAFAAEQALKQAPAASSAAVDTELAEARAALERAEEQLWDAKEQLVGARERVGALEGELMTLHQSHAEAEHARQVAVERVRSLEAEVERAVAARALAEGEARKHLAAPAPDGEKLRRAQVLAERLGALEQGLAGQVARLAEADKALALASAELAAGASGGDAEWRRAIEQKDQELQAALFELDTVKAQAEGQLQKMLADVDGMRRDKSGGRAEDRDAEVILLHTTVANHRRRAAKLKEEIAGYRARVQALSPAEVAGLLEEIGHDLSEIEK